MSANKTKILNLKIPIDVKHEIKRSDTLPEGLRIQVESRLRQQQVEKMSKKKIKCSIPDVEDRCAMLLKIIENRNNEITLDEILQEMEITKEKSSPMMQKFNKFLKVQGMSLTKKKKQGKTHYTLNK